MNTVKFNHRRTQTRLLKRREGIRKDRARVLIVCEGSKTEPNYFNALRIELELSRENIEICEAKTDSGQRASDPINIVKYALQKSNNSYDHVYCVFDKDRHTNYADALLLIKKSHIKGISIHAITSVPCFEYWILLHFEHTSRPYRTKGKKSPSEQLVSEIKNNWIKNYSKGHKTIFDDTKKHLDIAITRAKRVQQTQAANDTDNPSTKVHELVEFLRAN
jgi:hypothetical protein